MIGSFALAVACHRPPLAEASQSRSAVDDRADGIASPLSLVRPSSSSRSSPASFAASHRRAGRSRGPGSSTGFSNRSSVRVAREQGGDGRAGGQIGRERDQRSLGERIAGRGGPRRSRVRERCHTLRWRAGGRRAAAVFSLSVSVSLIRHATFSVDLSSRLGSLALDAPSDSFSARSIKGSRARNKVMAATTPVAAIGPLATASTASSARSAPFSFAPSQALRASAWADPRLQATEPCPSAERASARPRSAPPATSRDPLHRSSLSRFAPYQARP